MFLVTTYKASSNMHIYWISPTTSHVNHACNNLLSPVAKYLNPYIVLVPFWVKKITEFSRDSAIKSKSLFSSFDITALWSITSGSPCLKTFVISKKRENLLALSKNPTVVPNETGFVFILKL